MKHLTIIQFLINIIKCVLNGKTPDAKEYEQAELQMLYSFAKQCHTAGFVACCPGVIDAMPPELKQRFIYEHNRSIAREATQEVVISAFLDKMEEAGLRAMPLKGFQTKRAYPHPALRYMTDTDILIDEADMDKIKPIMESLGFCYDHETLHEIIFRSNQLAVELHKGLVHELRTTLYDYYKDAWSFGKLKDGKKYIYEMSPENLYVYTTSHLAKHYLEGGIGILHVADVFVLAKPDLDRVYIKDGLSKLGLREFEKNLHMLAKRWFSDEETDVNDAVLKMEGFILGSGAYGNDKNRTAAGTLLESEREGKKKSNLMRIIARIFVSPKHIKMLYPVVKKHCWLYPVFVVVRIWDIVFRRKDTMHIVHNLANVKDEEKAGLKQHFESVGLPINL